MERWEAPGSLVREAPRAGRAARPRAELAEQACDTCSGARALAKGPGASQRSTAARIVGGRVSLLSNAAIDGARNEARQTTR